MAVWIFVPRWRGESYTRISSCVLTLIARNYTLATQAQVRTHQIEVPRLEHLCSDVDP